MPLNTSLRQRGQRSIAMNHCVVARRASTNHVLTSQQSALTHKLRQNASYLQLGGMINWLYAVMTIFAQRFNICSSKFERSTALIAPPGYAPCNSD